MLSNASVRVFGKAKDFAGRPFTDQPRRSRQQAALTAGNNRQHRPVEQQNEAHASGVRLVARQGR